MGDVFEGGGGDAQHEVAGLGDLHAEALFRF
jgi:hypothetical protein